MIRRSGWRQGRSLYSLILRQTFGLQGATIAIGLALPALAVAPLPLQARIIDDAIPAADIGLALTLAALFLCAVALRAALKFALVLLRSRVAAIVNRTLRAALIDAQRHRSPRAAREKLGTVTSVLTGEVRPLGDFAAEAINTPLIQGGTLFAVLAYMAVTDWRLSAIGASGLALEAVVTPLLQIRINRLTERRIRMLRRAGADLIAAEGQQRAPCLTDGLRAIRHTYFIVLRMAVLKGLLKVSRNLIDHTTDIAVLTLGALFVMRGEIGLGIVVAFLSALRELRGPWGEIIGFYRRLADAAVKYRLVSRAMNGASGDLAAALASEPTAAVPPRLRSD